MEMEKKWMLVLMGQKEKVGGHVVWLTQRRCRRIMNKRLGWLISGAFNLYRCRVMFIMIDHSVLNWLK